MDDLRGNKRMDDKKKEEEQAKPPNTHKMTWKVKWAFVLLALFFSAVLFKGKEELIVNEREGTETISSSLQGNRPPRIIRAEIVPSSPDLQSALKAEFEAEDADRDPVTFRYRWLVNRKEVSDQPILPLAGFRQGDLVSLEIIPADEKAAGALFETPSVKIGNNPPVITGIQLLPREPKPGESIQVEVTGMDKDDDSIRYRYEWRINGQTVPGADMATLDGSLVHSADQIVVIVIPSDSFSEGTPKAGPPLTVVNQPPKITSLPSGGIQNNKYSYQVIAQDPDADPLQYLLVSGPPGMTLDVSSGLLDWTAEALRENKFQVTIEVNDAKGGKSIQQFSLQTK